VRKKSANQPSRMHNKPLNCLDVMAVVLCEELVLVYNKQFEGLGSFDHWA